MHKGWMQFDSAWAKCLKEELQQLQDLLEAQEQ